MRRRRVDQRREPETGDSKQGATAAHRAALEALFAPKGATTPAAVKAEEAAARRDAVRVITVPNRSDDPVRVERERLLDRILAARGRPAITKAAEEYLKAGHAFPRDQELHLQLLEHTSEERVSLAIVTLEKIIDDEPVKRETVLDSRLRSLDEHAELAETRELAAGLRRKLARKRSIG